MRWLPVVLVASLALTGAASAGDRELLEARDRYLPAARAQYPETPDGVQARYGAGRDLLEAVRAAGRVRRGLQSLRAELLNRATTQIRRAEALDRPAGSTSTGPLEPVPPSRAGRPPLRPDPSLGLRLAAAAATFDGVAGIWVHDLASGRYAGVEASTPFAAASTVKLAALVAVLRSSPRPERGRWWYDARQLGSWSSNLAANRILEDLGVGAIGDGLRRLGMSASTYPGPYRATTAARPPGPHTRVTTARDLGRALYRLHAAAHGDATALRLLAVSRGRAVLGLRVLLSSQPAAENTGLLKPWLGPTPVAEKNGWLSDTRTTAALVYRGGEPVIVVVEAYRPGLSEREARRLGREVLRAARLVR